MEQNFQLITREELVYGSQTIQKVLGMSTDKQLVVVPDRTIFECLMKLAQKDVTMKVVGMTDAIPINQQIFSQYPVLVHNSFVIQQSNILTYLKKHVSLYKEKSHRYEYGKLLEKLVTSKLSFLTVSSFSKQLQHIQSCMAEFERSNIVQRLWKPLKTLEFLWQLKESEILARNYWDVDLQNDISIDNECRKLHEMLEQFLQPDSRTFFDPSVVMCEEAKTEDVEVNLKLNISSLDLVVFAYLKQEVVNIPNSAAVKYLKANCPKLMAFYNFMESKFCQDQMSQQMISANKVQWRRLQDPQEIRRVFNSLLQRHQESLLDLIQQKFKNLTTQVEMDLEEEFLQEENSKKKTELLNKAKLELQQSEKYKLIYASIGVATLYLYLNFVKNPFN